MTQTNEELVSLIESFPQSISEKIYEIICEYCKVHELNVKDFTKILNENDEFVNVHVDTGSLPRGLLQILYKFVLFESKAEYDNELRLAS